jgi:hypothetical protein
MKVFFSLLVYGSFPMCYPSLDLVPQFLAKAQSRDFSFE